MIISESDGAELMDKLKISPDIRLNSELAAFWSSSAGWLYGMDNVQTQMGSVL